MRYLSLIAILILGSTTCLAQDRNAQRKTKPVHKVVYAPPQPAIYKVVEQYAAFPGDVAEYITSKMRYPENALENGMEGRALILFEVSAEGYVRVLSVKRSSGTPALDAEAKRVIGNMPRWRPARTNGVAKRSVMLMPVFFKID